MKPFATFLIAVVCIITSASVSMAQVTYSNNVETKETNDVESTQGYSLSEEESAEETFQNSEWEIKVAWIDSHGKKHKSKGQLLLAHDNGIMIRQFTTSGRSFQESVHARSIVKIKFKPRYNELPEILESTANGLLGGNPLGITTGNPYIDILTGALSGALVGIFNSPRNGKVVWVNRSSQVYRERVLPELVASR